MNTLFNSALKQQSQLRSDLDTFAASPATASPGLLGQISTTLTSFSRTIDDYSDTSKKELNPAKQEKARERIKTFRADVQDFRHRFESIKADRDESLSTQTRTELLGRRPHHASTPENPYASSTLPSAFGAPPSHQGSQSRESHARREQTFFQQSNAQLDEFVERGRAVLADLGQQGEVLRGTRRRLLGVANTLGVSGETIRMVERRARQDRWVFWGGVVAFFGFCWLVIWFLR